MFHLKGMAFSNAAEPSPDDGWDVPRPHCCGRQTEMSGVTVGKVHMPVGLPVSPGRRGAVECLAGSEQPAADGGMLVNGPRAVVRVVPRAQDRQRPGVPSSRARVDEGRLR